MREDVYPDDIRGGAPAGHAAIYPAKGDDCVARPDSFRGVVEKTGGMRVVLEEECSARDGAAHGHDSRDAEGRSYVGVGDSLHKHPDARQVLRRSCGGRFAVHGEHCG